MTLENVKVGDKLFVYNCEMECLEEVERLTSTLVITKYHRFRKNNGVSIGCNFTSPMYARRAVPDDEANIYRRAIVRKCEKIKFKNLSNSKLEEIIKIATNG